MRPLDLRIEPYDLTSWSVRNRLEQRLSELRQQAENTRGQLQVFTGRQRDEQTRKYLLGDRDPIQRVLELGPRRKLIPACCRVQVQPSLPVSRFILRITVRGRTRAPPARLFAVPALVPCSAACGRSGGANHPELQRIATLYFFSIRSSVVRRGTGVPPVSDHGQDGRAKGYF